MPQPTSDADLLAGQSFPADTNDDGLTDRLELNARLPLGEDEQVHSVKLLAVFRTRLRVRTIRKQTRRSKESCSTELLNSSV